MAAFTSYTPDQIVGLLWAPPSVSQAPPDVNQSTVLLYKDSNWSGDTYTVDLEEHAANERHLIPSNMADQTTWIAFNLPVGTVMTLMDNRPSTANGQSVADLRSCGRSIDLVGTGKTESVDLKAVGINDCLSSFFYRRVDLNLGAIQLFEKDNYTGNINNLFLCEWEPDKIFDFSSWWMNDKISSVRWTTLCDRQQAYLFEKGDGSGASYNNIKGWGRSKEIAKLSDVNMNDKASSFKWTGIVPVREEIVPFKIPTTNASGSTGFVGENDVDNKGTTVTPLDVTIDAVEAQTVTTSTEDAYATEISSTFSETVTAKVSEAGVQVGSSSTWTVGVKFSYAHKDVKTLSVTKTLGLHLKSTVNAAPMAHTHATLVANVGNFPDTSYTTTASRWYTVPVTGSMADPDYPGYYKRIESVVVRIHGGLGLNSALTIVSEPYTQEPAQKISSKV